MNGNNYKLVYFEIVGFCNAKCPWCVTGNKTLIEANYASRFIKIKDFKKAITRLLDDGLIWPGESVIHLYNWGEPMLHPELNGILEILNKNNIDFAISTNASKIVHLDTRVLANLCELRFSMPGFSQPSYHRIHQLHFYKILRNIEVYCQNIRKGGYPTKLTMAYHLYQFNIGEVWPAMQFCKDNGIDFQPYVAYLADFNLAKAYLDKSISKELLGKISKDLFLYYVDELIAQSPQNYRCPQFDILTIDEDCNVLTCCALPKGHTEYSLGKLSALSYSDIKESKLSREICAECLKSGFAYWVHNPLVPDYIKDFEYVSGERKTLAKRDVELQEKDRTIDSIINSKSYKLGFLLSWPIRYVKDRFFP